MVQRGLWFDGQVAAERQVLVEPGPRGLTLTGEDGTAQEVALESLVRLGGDAARLRLGHREIDGWRLILVEPFDPTVTGGLPRRPGSLAPATSRRTMVLLIGLCLTVTVLVGLLILAPQAIASHMPMAWERKLGSAFGLPVGLVRCEDPGAQAALDHMVDRLDPTARKDGLTIELTDLDVANAAALPGGRMIILKGLFQEVDHSDAIAGIVAHEIAHVRRRHVAAAMVRELGLGTVVTLLGGGAVASNAGGLLSLKFSRSAETEADADAIAMLKRAGIDPRPTAAAFEEFRQMEGEWPEWLGDHPGSAGRAQRFTASYDSRQPYRPALSADETRALLAACAGRTGAGAG